MALNLTSEGLRYPPEVRVRHETCSTICGTHVQAILDQKNLTGLAGGVREGQNRSKYCPKWTSFLALKGARTPEMDSNQSGAVGGIIWGPFPGSWTHLGASGRLQRQIRAILGQILTFPDPPCQLGQIFMVPNGLHRCPTNSITYSMFNSHLLGAF